MFSTSFSCLSDRKRFWQQRHQTGILKRILVKRRNRTDIVVKGEDDVTDLLHLICLQCPTFLSLPLLPSSLLSLSTISYQFFNWSIINTQYYVSFRRTTYWFNNSTHYSVNFWLHILMCAGRSVTCMVAGCQGWGRLFMLNIQLYKATFSSKTLIPIV